MRIGKIFAFGFLLMLLVFLPSRYPNRVPFSLGFCRGYHRKEQQLDPVDEVYVTDLNLSQMAHARSSSHKFIIYFSVCASSSCSAHKVKCPAAGFLRLILVCRSVWACLELALFALPCRGKPGKAQKMLCRAIRSGSVGANQPQSWSSHHIISWYDDIICYQQRDMIRS